LAAELGERAVLLVREQEVRRPLRGRGERCRGDDSG
jgi:hypothetical protein